MSDPKGERKTEGEGGKLKKDKEGKIPSQRETVNVKRQKGNGRKGNGERTEKEPMKERERKVHTLILLL